MAANRRFYEQSGYSRAGPASITVVTRIREGRPRAQAAPLREVRSTERDETQPFVTINCAALPETLVGSTLFGHKKGAFTGADADVAGAFGAADGGTLFLDEIGELPMTLQAKLLRVIQEGVVVPVGDHVGKNVDVRLIAATNRDLEREVADGRMRADLYHRVAAHMIRVPALAARRSDVPELFMFFLSRIRDEHPALSWLWESGAQWVPALPMSMIQALARHGFTGNVRELENLAERTARRNAQPGPFREIELGAGPVEPSPAVSARPVESTPARGAPAPRPAKVDPSVASIAELLTWKPRTVDVLFGDDATAAWDTLDEGADDETRRAALRERAADAFYALLESKDFNQSHAAAELGLSRTIVVKLMRELGIPRPADLTLEQIEAAESAESGELDAAAKRLRVSPTALKRRLTVLRL